MKQLFSLLAFITALFCAAAPTQAQEDEYGRWINGVSEAWYFDPKLSQGEIAIAKTRWAKIGEESQTVLHEWAGSYANASPGDVSGSQLRWSPQNGFVMFLINQCTAQVVNFSYGKIQVTPAAIVLRFEYNSKLSNQRQATNSKPAKIKLLFVKWRNAPHLIYEDEISGFGYYAAGFPQEFPYYFSKLQATQNDSADALPIFPEGYERFVKKPIKGEIATVGKKTVVTTNRIHPLSYVSRTSVSLNVGSVDGVKKGMTFYILNSKYEDSIQIESVGVKTSKGYVVRNLDEDSHSNPLLRKEDSDFLPLSIGVAVTTNYFKHLELIPSN